MRWNYFFFNIRYLTIYFAWIHLSVEEVRSRGAWIDHRWTILGSTAHLHAIPCWREGGGYSSSKQWRREKRDVLSVADTEINAKREATKGQWHSDIFTCTSILWQLQPSLPDQIRMSNCHFHIMTPFSSLFFLLILLLLLGF